jgi:NADH:ubiquinone reductase (H+-translocating)
MSGSPAVAGDQIIPSTTADRPRVVIIGGGFGGLEAARRLRRAPVRVIVLDRRNHHLFQPLLYQVATAALNPSDIAEPIRRVLRHQANAEVVLAEAAGIDVAARTVLLADGVLAYDYLILATGASHSYFGRDDWARFAPGLKSVEDALDIRRRILFAFEAAEREADPERRAAWLRFVVVGAGPTGVELAGALTEIARHALARDFRHIDPKQAQVILLEGTPRVLPSYEDDLSEKARQQLIRMGVDVRTGLMVTDIDDHGVSIGPERIEARTVLWAAGVMASPLSKTLGVPLDRAGRVLVEPDLTIPGHPEIFVVGDAAVEPWKPDHPTPGVAQGAMQGGSYAARVIRRRVLGRPYEPFRYSDHGDVAVIGRLAGVTNISWLGPFGRQGGFAAWALWLGIHIAYLIGFSNRIVVLVRWAWTFLTRGRGARLITGAELLPTIEEPEPPVLAPLEQDAVTPAGDGSPAVPGRV